jgi:hypothetical protein
VSDDQPKTPPVSPEIARALLELNPELRQKGINTNLVVGEANQAAQPAEAPPLRAEIDAVRQELAREEQRVAEAKARLDRELQQIKQRLLDRAVVAIAARDPSLAQPDTQKLLVAEKALFERIGLTPQVLRQRATRK